MIKKIIYPVGLICLFFVNSTGFADTARFQIELLVFSQNGSSREVFQSQNDHVQWPVAVAELSDFTGAEKVLGGYFAGLLSGTGYQSLVHAAWIQNIEADTDGTPVRIQDANGSLKGWISLRRGQTLQLTADFEMTPIAANDFSATVSSFRLKESRAIKFNEIHYFDHPKFGIITKVSPL